MYLYDVQLMLTAWAMTFLCSLLVLETFYFDIISLYAKLKQIFIIYYMPADNGLKLLYSSMSILGHLPVFLPTPSLHLSKNPWSELSPLTAIYSPH